MLTAWVLHREYYSPVTSVGNAYCSGSGVASLIPGSKALSAIKLIRVQTYCVTDTKVSPIKGTFLNFWQTKARSNFLVGLPKSKSCLCKACRTLHYNDPSKQESKILKSVWLGKTGRQDLSMIGFGCRELQSPFRHWKGWNSSEYGIGVLLQECGQLCLEGLKAGN
jgi:hypothetical protein